MRVLIQRVTRARVRVAGATVGAIDLGLLAFVGVKHDDDDGDATYLAARTAALRIFGDDAGKMNRALGDVGGKVLAVSQFTLHADTRKGNRPSFVAAAPPERAERLYNLYVDELRRLLGPDAVRTGTFRASMEVELANDGPVTVLLESKSEYGGRE
jgi:D-tyrosyl-tRNA(Tyr) deacylase